MHRCCIVALALLDFGHQCTDTRRGKRLRERCKHTSRFRPSSKIDRLLRFDHAAFEMIAIELSEAIEAARARFHVFIGFDRSIGAREIGMRRLCPCGFDNVLCAPRTPCLRKLARGKCCGRRQPRRETECLKGRRKSTLAFAASFIVKRFGR